MSSEPAPASTAAAVPVDIRRFPWIRRLAIDYIYAHERVAPFFAGDPASPAAWTSAVTRAQQSRRAAGAVSRLLVAQLERRAAPAAARASAAALADPRTVAVVTGQQAGLYGGPLFTLLKALTAVRLAETAARAHGVRVVPIFWIDAEDHDWAEVSACTVLDAELEPRTIRLADLDGAGDRPVGRLALDDRVAAAHAELAARLPRTEFSAALLDDLRDIYRPGIGMVAAFGQLLDRLLGPRGLVVFDASDPAAKPIVRDVFVREIAAAGATARLAADAGRRLEALGYHAQAAPAAGSLSLFYLDGRRDAVKFEGREAIVGERRVPLAALADEADRTPEHFSPNVLLRPLVQDTLFPTIAYVAGPNELAYLGQLRGVYEHFGVPMPLVYPRATATLLDAAAARFLARYRLAFEALQRQDEAALNHLLEEHLPPGVEQAFADAADTVRARLASVAAAVRTIDPTLEGAVRSTESRMTHDLRTLHGKVIQAAKRRDETLRRQFRRARAQAFPRGHPQERAVGIVWFLNRYGPALVERLFDALPSGMGQHWLLTI